MPTYDSWIEITKENESILLDKEKREKMLFGCDTFYGVTKFGDLSWLAVRMHHTAFYQWPKDLPVPIMYCGIDWIREVFGIKSDKRIRNWISVNTAYFEDEEELDEDECLMIMDRNAEYVNNPLPGMVVRRWNTEVVVQI